MNLQTKVNETEYKDVIRRIINKYEIKHSYWILSALELVGLENSDFWLQVVNYVEKTKGIDEISNYVILIQLLSLEDLRSFIKTIKDYNQRFSYEESYNIFTEVHRSILNEKKSNEENNNFYNNYKRAL